jgi:aspartate/methionine/tyrosine aminotransferase
MPAELAPNRLSAAIAAMQRASRPYLDLTLSNPTRAGFTYDPQLLAPLAHPRGLAYAPEPLGLRAARQAVAEEFLRQRIDVSPDRIALTASTSDAYSLLFKLLCNPGDDVLVPRPSYPLFDHLTRLDGVTAVGYDLEYHGRWSIDCASVRRAITPRTKALLLVSPNNPTGNIVSREELDEVDAVCAAHNIAMIADEVFADYVIDAEAGERAGHLFGRHALGFTLGGLSKSVGLPQLKLGWIALSGPEPIVSAAQARLEFACDTYLSVATPVQAAARDILTLGVSVRRQIEARIVANYHRLEALAGAAPATTLLRAEGGWYAVLQVPTFRSEEDLALHLLTEHGVLAHPGYFFDFSHESFLILSLLTPEADFEEGVRRILSVVPFPH